MFCLPLLGARLIGSCAYMWGVWWDGFADGVVEGEDAWHGYGLVSVVIRCVCLANGIVE